MTSKVDLAELASPHVPEPVAYAAIVPSAQEPLPVCLVLHGGGASRDFLPVQQPLFDALWASGELPPMLLATPSVGELSFYLDAPDGKVRWESFLLESFLPHLRERYPVRGDRAGTLVIGASMGGYGALKLAFRHPERFAAVAAMEPAIEPALRAEDSGPRNRFFYPEGAPSALIAADRDPALWAANQPASRLVGNAAAIRDSGLSIYLEVGDEDLMNLHDGAEFLHRLLWEHQVPHEYHLVKGGDHVGPTIVPRTREAFLWLGAQLRDTAAEADAPLSDTARAWIAWMDRGFTGEVPPPLDMASAESVRVLREQYKEMRARALEADATTALRYGRLPPTSAT